MYTLVMSNKHFGKVDDTAEFNEACDIITRAYRERKSVSTRDQRAMAQHPSISRFAHMIVIQRMINEIHKFGSGGIMTSKGAGSLQSEEIARVIYEIAFQLHDEDGPGLAGILEEWSEEYGSYGNFGRS